MQRSVYFATSIVFSLLLSCSMLSLFHISSASAYSKPKKVQRSKKSKKVAEQPLLLEVSYGKPPVERGNVRTISTQQRASYNGGKRLRRIRVNSGQVAKISHTLTTPLLVGAFKVIDDDSTSSTDKYEGSGIKQKYRDFKSGFIITPTLEGKDQVHLIVQDRQVAPTRRKQDEYITTSSETNVTIPTDTWVNLNNYSTMQPKRRQRQLSTAARASDANQDIYIRIKVLP